MMIEKTGIFASLFLLLDTNGLCAALYIILFEVKGKKQKKMYDSEVSFHLK